MRPSPIHRDIAYFVLGTGVLSVAVWCPYGPIYYCVFWRVDYGPQAMLAVFGVNVLLALLAFCHGLLYRRYIVTLLAAFVCSLIGLVCSIAYFRQLPS